MKPRHLLPLALACVQAACIWVPPDPQPAPEPEPFYGESAGRPRVDAGTTVFAQPSITSIEVPNWPPLGKDDVVRIACVSPNGTGNVTATFAKSMQRFVTSDACASSFTGAELGEGMGTLTLTLRDAVGAGAQRQVENLVVDLGAPGVDVEATTLRPGGEIAFHVYDAWVLGSVDVTIDGTTQTFDFPDVYPRTLGVDFDQSRVTFPVATTTLGKRQAVVVVRDAAGNTLTRSFDLRIDGTPPTIGFSSPAAGATVPKHFDVSFTASDDLAASPHVELRIGGSYAGTFDGTSGKLTVDATTFGAGPLTVELVARDDAGNETVATRTVTVQ